MIEIIRYSDGKIMAVCEWWLLNDSGQMDPSGKLLWVNELEIVSEARGNGVLRKIILLIHDKVPDDIKVAFVREYKYKGRKPRVWNKEQITRHYKKEKDNGRDF